MAAWKPSPATEAETWAPWGLVVRVTVSWLPGSTLTVEAEGVTTALVLVTTTGISRVEPNQPSPWAETVRVPSPGAEAVMA